jgi:hypothetical protein
LCGFLALATVASDGLQAFHQTVGGWMTTRGVLDPSHVPLLFPSDFQRADRWILCDSPTLHSLLRTAERPSPDSSIVNHAGGVASPPLSAQRPHSAGASPDAQHFRNLNLDEPLAPIAGDERARNDLSKIGSRSRELHKRSLSGSEHLSLHRGQEVHKSALFPKSALMGEFDRGASTPRQHNKVLYDPDTSSNRAHGSTRGTEVTSSAAAPNTFSHVPAGRMRHDHRTHLFDRQKVKHDSASTSNPQPASLWRQQGSKQANDNTGAEPTDYLSSGIFLQPETHPITEEQLVNEVRAIYAGLVMVEKKCMEIDKQQSNNSEKLTEPQWQALIALHRTLLHEHHDFFLASNHPAASSVLKRLAGKYSMPARMWRYGIHSFLELLRKRLPGSLDHMLTFIYMAYAMMTLLLESVPAFEETWIECLGDLARYRMAVEENDMRDREVWSGVARYWYTKAADKSPDIGRIQHHLAVLARPNTLQQLFYYSKSLVSIQPFTNAQDSILLLFGPLLDPLKPTNKLYPRVLTVYVTAHAVLFTRGEITAYMAHAEEFTSHIDGHISRVGALFREQGVYVASAAIAAIFGFGQADAVIPRLFDQKIVQQWSLSETLKSSERVWANPQLEQIAITRRDRPATPGVRFKDNEQVVSYASHLGFSTFKLILERQGDKNVLPSVHVFLAFIWSFALIPQSMMYIQADIPWTSIAAFLTTLIRPETEISKIESEQFPVFETGSSKQLPEDFLIRGLAWSQLYYPKKFFLEISDDEERSIELPSVVIPRTHRCLWLGVRIARVRAYHHFSYRHNTDQVFSSNAGSPTILKATLFLPRRSHASWRAWAQVITLAASCLLSPVTWMPR